MINFKIAKEEMIKSQLFNRGIVNKRILKAFEEIDRHLFVKEENIDLAYDDCSLPLLEEQTISQPYMTALMLDLLHPLPDDRILEIGTGSGFQTALLSKLVKYVISVEKVRELVDYSKSKMNMLQIENTSIFFGDGTLGWRENSPYDGIVVSAGSPEIPSILMGQLKVGGRLVIPVGKAGNHMLKLVLKEENGYTVKNVINCSFVPLIGKGIKRLD